MSLFHTSLRWLLALCCLQALLWFKNSNEKPATKNGVMHFKIFWNEHVMSIFFGWNCKTSSPLFYWRKRRNRQKNQESLQCQALLIAHGNRFSLRSHTINLYFWSYVSMSVTLSFVLIFELNSSFYSETKDLWDRILFSFDNQVKSLPTLMILLILQIAKSAIFCVWIKLAPRSSMIGCSLFSF